MSTNANLNTSGKSGKGIGMVQPGVVLAIIFGLSLVVWLGWSPFWLWYDLRGLASATDTDRALWVQRVAILDESAIPGLVQMMMHAEVESSNNARAALAVIVRRWTPSDARTSKLSSELASEYISSAGQGRFAVLSLAREICEQSAESPLGMDLLAVVQPKEEVVVFDTALELARVLLDQKNKEVVESVKKLVHLGLNATEASHRIKSVRLAMRAEIQMVEQVASLLNDPVPEVRRIVIVAVGSAADVVLDETLLPSLRDTDAEVRRLCEQSLRARGLSDDHLRLSRFLVDPAPSERLKVLDHLGDSIDLEPGVWLRRLSHDPAPSVRASAVRVMALQKIVDLSDRLDQMARTDPSPSVSYLARFYINNVPASQSNR